MICGPEHAYSFTVGESRMVTHGRCVIFLAQTHAPGLAHGALARCRASFKIMLEPQVRFDVRGGSPTLLEVSFEGKSYEIRVGLNIMDVQIAPGVNPLAPDQPLFSVNVGLNVLQKPLEP